MVLRLSCRSALSQLSTFFFNVVAYTIGWIIMHIVVAGVSAMNLDTFKPHSSSPDSRLRKWMTKFTT